MLNRRESWPVHFARLWMLLLITIGRMMMTRTTTNREAAEVWQTILEQLEEEFNRPRGGYARQMIGRDET